MPATSNEDTFQRDGFRIVENVFSPDEVEHIKTIIASAAYDNPRFRRTGDLFAIRHCMKELPELKEAVFNTSVIQILNNFGGSDLKIVKSIYFDKPPLSNWFVAYHQDLTISVQEKADVPGYGLWTKKHESYAVQPPEAFLRNILTLRIHLDDTDENNGALKVIPGSHNSITRMEKTDKPEEKFCNVPGGGVMLMRPLLMHSSGRTTDNRRRRVIHIEFSPDELPKPLVWAERENL
ncbi:MAG: phytanoyl-CoA dioxygenase family protein [Mucilaginibacter polytrichastri]|nr:phytanoyl-CoA dioxygenase family protein [Mucilaginibacter polytrichastri]